MFGFGKKQKSVELPRFRFATLPDPIAPTIATEDILQKQKIIVGLGTLLISLTVIARLAYGMTTPVTFVDSDGYPWPIVNVTYNPTVLAQDGAGCGASPKELPLVDGKKWPERKGVLPALPLLSW